MLHKAVLAAVFCGMILLTIQPAASQNATQTLVGSWEFTLTPNSPPVASSTSVTPTPPVPPPIPGLATFTSDGTVIETDLSAALLVSVLPAGTVIQATPGHGIWQPGPAFGRFFVRFISLVANVNATLHAKRIVTMMLGLNAAGDQFSGGYTIQMVDPTGHAITTSSGTIVGQLIPHPLLP